MWQYLSHLKLEEVPREMLLLLCKGIETEEHFYLNVKSTQAFIEELIHSPPPPPHPPTFTAFNLLSEKKKFIVLRSNEMCIQQTAGFSTKHLKLDQLSIIPTAMQT